MTEPYLERGLYDRAKVGAKPVRPVASRAVSSMCLRAERPQGAVCTRDRDHEGQCVAEGASRIVAVWWLTW